MRFLMSVEEPTPEIIAAIEGMAPTEQMKILREMKVTSRNAADLNFYIGNTFFSLGELDSAVAYYHLAAPPILPTSRLS